MSCYSLAARLNADLADMQLSCIGVSGMCGHAVNFTAAVWWPQVPQVQHHPLGSPHLLQLRMHLAPFSSQMRHQAHLPVVIQQAAHQAHQCSLRQSALHCLPPLLLLQRPCPLASHLPLHLVAQLQPLLLLLLPLRLHHP